jgi:hypothetical protein
MDPRSTAPYLTVGQDGKENTVNEAIATLSVLTVGSAISISNAPPVTPIEGQLYIVGDTPTGAWAAKPNQLAVARANSAGGWKFYPPQAGWRVALDSLDGLIIRWNGSNWTPVGKAGYVESTMNVSTPIVSTAGTKITLATANGAGGLSIASNEVIHGAGRFIVNAFCNLLGVASVAGGEVEVWIKAGSYERFFGTLRFPLTPGSKEAAAVSIEITAAAADNIQLIIKNPTNIASLAVVNSWIQVREQ